MKAEVFNPDAWRLDAERIESVLREHPGEAICDALASELCGALRFTGGSWRFRLRGLVTFSTASRREALRGWARRARERARLFDRDARAAS